MTTIFRHEYKQIVLSPMQALVNPVNCIGVSGDGLARVFRYYFPLEHKAYIDLCQEKGLSLGTVALNPIINTPKGKPTRYIVWFPTKYHFKDTSTLESIDEGLISLADSLRRLNIMSVAVPLLGCGLGGLQKEDVIPLIKTRLDGATGSVTIHYRGTRYKQG